MAMITRLLAILLLMCSISWANQNQPSRIVEQDGKVQLNLNNVDVEVIIKYLARFSGEHYLIDPTVKGKISIMANKPVTRQEAIIILEEALIFNNFTIMKNGLAKYVIPTRFAKQYGIEVKIGDAGVRDIKTANLEMRFFKVDYIGVRKMNTILNTILGKNGQIIPHVQERMLQVIDTTFSLKRMHELIEKMDVPDALLEMYVVHLENTKAAKIIGQLKAIFANNLTLKGSPNVIEAEEDKMNFIADDRTNKIIAISHPKYIDQIRETVRLLDQELGAINEVQIFRVKHAEPDALAKQLAELFPKDAVKIVADERLQGLLIISQSDRMIQAVMQMARKLDLKADATGGDVRVYYLEHTVAKDMADTLTKLFEKKKNKDIEPVSIVPDEATNALIVTGTKAQFEEVLAILEKLDIFRAQVLVEAVIVETKIGFARELGFKWVGGKRDNGDLFALTSNIGLAPALNSGMNIGFAENISNVEDIVTNQDNIRALLKAVKNNNEVNILSAPQILTVDNEEATITVGEVVPLPTGVNTALNNGNQTISNFRFEDVGLDLTIKPRITQKRTISLEVKLDIKARSNDTLFDFDVPIISRRSVTTVVNTKDKNTAVIGGLMRDQKTHSDDRIPFFARLPLIGRLFHSKSTQMEKTNLFVFLTPYILSNEEELKTVTQQVNTKFEKGADQKIFHPLSYKEGIGVYPEGAREEAMVQEVKIERIALDGTRELLKDSNPTTVKSKQAPARSRETKVVEPAKPVQKSVSSEKKLKTSDANPDKISADEIKRFQMLMERDRVKPLPVKPMPRSMGIRKSSIHRLAGEKESSPEETMEEVKAKEVSSLTVHEPEQTSQEIVDQPKLVAVARALKEAETVARELASKDEEIEKAVQLAVQNNGKDPLEESAKVAVEDLESSKPGQISIAKPSTPKREGKFFLHLIRNRIQRLAKDFQRRDSPDSAILKDRATPEQSDTPRVRVPMLPEKGQSEVIEVPKEKEKSLEVSQKLEGVVEPSKPVAQKSEDSSKASLSKVVQKAQKPLKAPQNRRPIRLKVAQRMKNLVKKHEQNREKHLAAIRNSSAKNPVESGEKMAKLDSEGNDSFDDLISELKKEVSQEKTEDKKLGSEDFDELIQELKKNLKDE